MRRIRKRQSYGFRGVGSSFRAMLRELHQTRDRLESADPRHAADREDQAPSLREPRPVRRGDELR